MYCSPVVTDGGKIMAVRHAHVVASAIAAIGMIASTAPAHAVAEYARGEFNYPAIGESLCIEIYVNSGIGSAECAARIEVGLFGAVVRHSQDGTCTGIAPAKLWITSPSIHSVPAANGYLFVSHGEGVFEGYGSNGVIVSTASARLTGSRCTAQEVLGLNQSLTGSYLLHA